MENNIVTMTPKQLKQALIETLIPNRMATLIVSDSGIGKTDIVNQAAMALNADVIPFYPAVEDPTNPKGMPYFYQKNGEPFADFVPYGDTRKLIEAQKLTIGHLEDLGQGSQQVQASYMQWILARRLGNYVFSDQICFIACTNRRRDRSGVVGILRAVLRRFVTIVYLTVSPKDWVEWALTNNMPIELIAFIRLNPKMLFDENPSKQNEDDMINTYAPRTVANVGRLQNAGIPKGLEYALFSGAAGSIFASEYLGFLKIKDQLPNPEVILMSPEKAIMPTEPSALYVICGMLTDRATEINISNIEKYAARMPADFSVLLFKDIAIRKPELQKTRGFIEWGIKHQNVTI